MDKKFESYLRFVWAGISKQVQTGAIIPSQKFLVDKMIAPIPASYRGTIVELGAGTGALTIRLARRCPEAKIVACEINPELARDLRQNLRRAGINGEVEVVSEPAEKLLPRLRSKAAEKPKYIVSGIPLGNVPRKNTLALIEQIKRSLADDGMYIQFQYSLLDRAKIRAAFPRLRTAHVLLNFPPAFIYFASKGGHSTTVRPPARASRPGSLRR